MTAVVTIVCCLALQQLMAVPESPAVGEPVTVRARLAAAPANGVRVEVVLPDGVRQEVGTTDAAGELRFVPAGVGQHTFVAELGGVRHLTPVFAQSRARRWWLVVVTAPLGLALLWFNLRRLVRVGSSAGAA